MIKLERNVGKELTSHDPSQVKKNHDKYMWRIKASSDPDYIVGEVVSSQDADILESQGKAIKL